MNFARRLCSSSRSRADLCAWTWLVLAPGALVGCSPEVVELVHFADDAEAQAPGDAGEDTGTEMESSPGLDAGRGTGSELDARVRPPFFDFDAGAQRGCSSNDDCSMQDYCLMTSCGAKRGTCTLRPSFCTGEQGPAICGCDGLRYFNDCLRAYYGANVDPTCLALRPCSSTAPCPEHPDHAAPFCSNLYRSQCRQGPPERYCWVMPAQCGPNTLGGDLFMACDAPSSGSDSCLSVCEAIKTEVAYGHVSRSCGPRTGPSGSDFMP
jgi:hypothetical protein